MKQPKQQYNKWTEYEDEVLLEIIDKSELINWEKISNKLSQDYGIKRRGKQCRQRWENHTSSKIKSKDWSNEDNLKIFNYYLEYGTSWVRYIKHFQRKTDLHIKNRFNSMIRKALRKMCKYFSLSWLKKSIYSIRTSTISKIFAKNNQQQMTNYSLPEYFNKSKCAQIMNLFEIFIFKNQLMLKYSCQQIKQIVCNIIKLNNDINPKEDKEQATERDRIKQEWESYDQLIDRMLVDEVKNNNIRQEYQAQTSYLSQNVIIYLNNSIQTIVLKKQKSYSFDLDQIIGQQLDQYITCLSKNKETLSQQTDQ